MCVYAQGNTFQRRAVEVIYLYWKLKEASVEMFLDRFHAFNLMQPYERVQVE